MSTLELRRLSKVYPNGDVAVHGLDVSIADGEFFVLVGPSGCGKTTALRMIAGLEVPTSGDILIDDVRVNDVSPRERDIAMAFQQGALYPHMTVAENIGFPLRLAGLPKAAVAERVARVAGLLSLGACLERRPGLLSGGERQRASMGRALVREPRLLLLDEPMSNLDAKLRTEARGELLRIQQALGVTTIHVTHDQVEAMALADRVAVMNHGHVVQCASPMEVYGKPADLFVAQFMGSPPMSVVRGKVIRADGELAVQVGRDVVVFDAAADPRSRSLDRLENDHVAIGFRPEAFRVDPHGSVTVSLEHREMLGAEQLVHAVIAAPRVVHEGDGVTVSDEPSSLVTALLATDEQIDLWRPIRLAVDTSRVHLFELSTGLPIRPG